MLSFLPITLPHLYFFERLLYFYKVKNNDYSLKVCMIADVPWFTVNVLCVMTSNITFLSGSTANIIIGTVCMWHSYL